MPDHPLHALISPALTAALLCGLLAGCALPVIDEAERLSRNGQYEQALARLDSALAERPGDAHLRTAHSHQRDRVIAQALARADLAQAGGHLDEAERLAARVRELDAQHPRLAPLQAQLAQGRQAQQRAAAERATASAAAAARARAPATATATATALPLALAAAYQKPVALEFREAPLRQVFEALARSTGVNFVFDKDVRGDAKVTVFLRNVTLDEALRVILATQALDRKLLNDSTVLVFPNTAAKQREHQELITRSLYLGNADARQVLTLVRTMAKTRDLYADERLNALVVRDTPEVVRLVEQLIATLDLPEPEVMLAVEVMEVASNRLDELGLGWPTAVQYGLPGASGLVALGERSAFRASVANPALLATLRGDAGSTNLLANPTIRARNREKAKVQIGEKLPVFSTTSATVNVGASTTITYLDVGLKLDVEPTVQLDGDVTIKVALEVSNLLREVSGPGGSLAYQVGSRLTTTTLRLQDGETQVLAGLINDEDRQRAVGVPGLSQAPLVGKLFGVQSDTRNKTEIVMMITPRIVRRLAVPSLAAATLQSGTDSQPGATPLRLRPAARVALAAPATGRSASASASASAAPTGQAGDAAVPQADPPAAAPASPAAGAGPAASLQLSASAEAAVGGTVAVTLRNHSGLRLQGALDFDPLALQPASAALPSASGRLAFDIGPRGDAVLLLRVLAAAAGQRLIVQVQDLLAHDAQGRPADASVEGEALVQIAAEAATAAGSQPP